MGMGQMPGDPNQMMTDHHHGMPGNGSQNGMSMPGNGGQHGMPMMPSNGGHAQMEQSQQGRHQSQGMPHMGYMTADDDDNFDY